MAALRGEPETLVLRRAGSRMSKRDKAILAAILCGSMSHDTVWVKSDIDLALVTIDDRTTAKGSGVSLYANGVNVHAFLMPRAEFRRVAEGALRGAGNTTFPLWANTIGFWLAVGLSALAAWRLNLGLVGLWGAYAIVIPCLGFILWRRFRRKDWQHATLTTGGAPVVMPDA